MHHQPTTLTDTRVMSAPILKYFDTAHLPADLRTVSEPIHALAHDMDANLPDCAEKTAGLRKLLEAKDCLVRAALEKRDQDTNSH